LKYAFVEKFTMSKPHRWQFWVDRGGTFTDIVARDPQGEIRVGKLLSENPDQYPDAPLEGIRRMLGLRTDDEIPADQIDHIKMGTTLATNALLERKGAPVGFLVTEGFADLLEIGYQDRPDLFALNIEKPEMLYSVVREVPERILANGTKRKTLVEKAVRAALVDFHIQGVDSVAVLLLHSFAYPEHEQRVGELVAEAGFKYISLSHEIVREIKAVGRGDTTVADAYLTPILRRYVGSLRSTLGDEVSLRFMQSNGGLTDAETFSGKNAILSGPAGGVVAYAHVSQKAGFGNVIGFDMGGTSTDVSRFDGGYDRVFETMVAGVRLKAPMMAIETVAAGGGSILQFDNGRLQVGPESAGAYPGPACYRNGGPATVTDANLVLGRIQPNYFPSCFGPETNDPLDGDASRARIEEIAKQIETATGQSLTIEETAHGFIQIANENMAKPIKEISVAKGYDVQEYALNCFGGAGAQHACAISRLLGIKTILLHPYAGVLSAYGMGMADAIMPQVQSVLTRLGAQSLKTVNSIFKELESAGRKELFAEGFKKANVRHERSMDLRYEGVDAYLNVPAEVETDSRKEFEALHQQRYGFVKPDHPIEIVNVRVDSVGITEKHSETEEAPERKELNSDGADSRVTAWLERTGADTSVPVYLRTQFRAGTTVQGPCLIIEDVSTIFVDEGWKVDANRWGHLVLTDTGRKKSVELDGANADPIMLEIFNNLFMSAATQMGEMLERVSHSANIKERLDFSCALFDQQGNLIANAPHIPVHLGAMSESVKAILSENRDRMKPGDVFVTNDPYHGGSHLPDVTVVSPVYIGADQPDFFVASRGHHADIGGITPGSMPPFSKSIDEEGIVIHNFKLVEGGQFREKEIVDLLLSGPWPARNIPERLSDLRAQIAANKMGDEAVKALCDQYGVAGVKAYMDHVRENATRTMRQRIGELPDGIHESQQYLDSGDKIVCRITIDGSSAVVDFSGTDPQLKGNLNAPKAVVVSAVLYCFRTLIGSSIPLNSGCLEPLEIIIPDGTLLSPKPPAAVVGGNVETSNRVVDAVYEALGIVAGSQGTMNNLTFGTEDWGYYETICGGAGAGPGFDGASAVHTHMTNTRITDPEILERRYPVVLNEFSIRKGSGGKGDWNGGDGIVRQIEFLDPVSVGLLTERRNTQPYGLNGAQPGKPGKNTQLMSDNSRKPLEGHAHIEVDAGEKIIIETPGGGGYNRPE
jgi:5-oxoprolinase (ATP-hydrolysing)